jgi:hypothetical protein
MVISRRLTPVLLAGVAGLFGLTLAACAPSASSSNGPTPPPGGSGALGGAPEATTSAAAPPAATYPGDAGAYATAAVTAWSQGDHARLAQLDAPGDTIFSTLDSGNYNKAFSLYRCDGAAGSSICALYNAVGDELDLRVLNSRLGQDHAVQDGQWHPITFPTDNRAYAEEAVHAWSGHNDAAVSLLTGKPGATAFSAVPAARRDDVWTYSGSDGGMGHLYYHFANAAGDNIIVSMANEGFATIPPNRHGLIEVVYYQAHA